MSFVDSLEPYWLAASLAVAFPSLLLSTFVYLRILRIQEYRKNRYIRLFLCKSLNEVITYFSNLFLLHLPIQNYLYSFFNPYTHSPLVAISGFIITVTILASFLYGISLSLNRYIAISHIAWFRKYNNNYTLISVVFAYPLPILFGLRALILPPFFVEINGKDGPIFLFYTPKIGSFTDIYEYTRTAYYLLCSAVELVVNGMTLKAIVSNNVFVRSSSKRQSERGLFATTVCSCLLNFLFTAAQVCIQFFPLTPAAFIAIRGQLVVVDIMSLSGVYLLIAFSPALRKKIFRVRTKINILPPASSNNGN